MPMTDEERKTLVGLAASAVESQICGTPKPSAGNVGGVLAEMRGCFVTLTNAGRLRGCIGTFNPHIPLAEMIIEMAQAASGHDSRFFSDPITPGELDSLSIEVSVLSPLEETADPAALTIGTHGIFIISQGQSGCFLPEVATDQGWDAEEFLSYCCAHKAGLPADAWKAPDTKVYLFTSEQFHG